MSRKIVYLLRHGEITQRTPRRFVGQSELSLTENGMEQMRRAGEWLAQKGIKAVYASPLGRTMGSAACVNEFLGLNCTPVLELKEINLGAWENLSVDEVRAAYPGEYEQRGKNIARYRPLDGESFADVQQRAVQALEEVVERAPTGASVAVVAHGGVNRTVLCHLLGMPLENLFRLEQDYGCINILEFGSAAPDNMWSVRLMNFRP